MSKQCPFCLKDDVADGAVKCHHCGTWIDDAKQLDEYEAFRREMREELAGDLKTHTETLEKSLSRIQLFAGFVVAVAAAATVYVGVRTDRSVTEIADSLEARASAQMETRIGEVTNKFVDSVDDALALHMKSEEVATQLDSAIAASLVDSVKGEVSQRLEAEEGRIDEAIEQALGQVAGASAKATEVFQQITDLEAQAQGALGRVQSFEASFEQAWTQTLEQGQSIKGFETLRVEPVEAVTKGGRSELPSFVDQKVNVLKFRIGSVYSALVTGEYIARLNMVPEFRFVVVQSQDDQVLGYWNSRQLQLFLWGQDSESDAALSAGFGLVPERAVERLEEFVWAIARQDLPALAEFQGFVAAEEMVGADWSSLRALQYLTDRNFDRAPVLSLDGTLAGYVDRSQLTTRVLIEIAGRQ